MIDISLKLSKINDNINKVAKEVDELVVVTKSLNLTEELVRGLSLSNHYVYDTRLDNLKLLKKLNKKLLFHYPYYKMVGDETSRVIVSSIDELEGAMDDKVKTIYLNFDLGDNRDGFLISQKEEVLNNLKSHDLKNRDIGLMSNIGCFKSEKPSKKYFSEFNKLGEYFIERQIIISHSSIGGSNCLPFLKEEIEIPKNIELRVGEALLIGTIPHSNNGCGLSNKIVFLKANIIKREGLSLINIGYNYLDQSCILNKSDIKILFQSSEMSCLGLNEETQNGLIEGDKILIPINYQGLSRLSHVKKVIYNFI